MGCLHNAENNIEISFDALMGSVFCKFVVLMTSVITSADEVEEVMFSVPCVCVCVCVCLSVC